MCSEKAVPMAVEEVLRKLMLGLIYPAVLGSVIYSALEPLVTAFTSIRLAFSRGGYTVDTLVALKLLTLFGTIAFHLFDYLYIMFTRQYRRLFFLYDCIFTATLYVTVVSIGLIDTETRSRPPDLRTIIVCFLIFMGLYLVWDLTERRNATNSEGERILYNKVIKWELLSLVGFGSSYVVAMCFSHTVLRMTVFVLILSAVTVVFGRLSWEKRQYSNGD